MASTGKKGKKTQKGKTVSLNDFLAVDNGSTGDSTIVVVPSKSSWADDVDDYDNDTVYSSRRGGDRGGEKIVLPTAPRSSLDMDLCQDRIPHEPPFTAYIANLSYECEDEDVYKFFENCKITNVRLLRDGDPESGRLKGFGYADFADRESLVEALSMNDHQLKNRKIRIDVSTNSTLDKSGGRGGFGDRMGRDGGNRGGTGSRYEDEGDDRTAGDWRSGPAPVLRDDDRQRGSGDRYEPPRDRGGDRGGDDRRSDNRGYGFDRQGDRGGFERRDDRGGPPDRRDDGGGGGDRDRRGGYGDRDRRDGGGFDRDRRDGGGFDRDRRDGGGFDRDRRDGGGFDRDRREGGGFDRDRRDGGGYDRDRRGGGDRYERPSSDRRSPNRDEGPRERPKLQLAKRSGAPVDSPSGESSSASIFGAAKPVDTAKKEREIEEKLQQKREIKRDIKRENRSRTTSEKSGSEDGGGQHAETGEKAAAQPPPASKARPSIFGQAKPVDTSKKEREIEEKLKKVEITKKIEITLERSSEKLAERSRNSSSGAATGIHSDQPVDRKTEDEQRVKSPQGEKTDIPMKKMEEAKPPNFAGSNKFAILPDEENVDSGKEDSE